MGRQIMGKRPSGGPKSHGDPALHDWIVARIDAMPREARSALLMFLHFGEVEGARGSWDIVEDGSIKLSLSAREELPDD
jgi:hypothetical protein